MKYIIVFVLIFGGYQFYTKKLSNGGFSPFSTVQSEIDFIAVYGRDSCSVTKQTKSFLTKNGIEYKYFSVDDKAVANSLHERMEQQGISTRRYNLPVVDFRGELNVRPSKKTIIENSNG